VTSKREIDFSATVAKLRCHLDISQRRLAEGLGVTEATVSNWERGKHKPKMRQAYKIEKLVSEYGLHIDYLPGKDRADKVNP